MRRRLSVLVMAGALMWSSGAAILAQDQNNPDVLRKELAETMSQLKAAQDRKNELANEYEKLKAQMATMQKQLDDANRALAENAERTYAIRAQQAAWNAFLDRDPRLRTRWEIFLETPIADLTTTAAGDWLLATPTLPSLFDASAHATTAPATAPAASTAPAAPIPHEPPPTTQPAATTTTAPASHDK